MDTLANPKLAGRPGTPPPSSSHSRCLKGWTLETLLGGGHGGEDPCLTQQGLHWPCVPSSLTPGQCCSHTLGGPLGTFSLPDELSSPLHLHQAEGEWVGEGSQSSSGGVGERGRLRRGVQDPEWSQGKWNRSIPQIITVCRTPLSMAVGDPVARADFGC